MFSLSNERKRLQTQMLEKKPKGICILWIEVSVNLQLSRVAGGRAHPSDLWVQVEGTWVQICCCCSEQIWVIVIAIHAAARWRIQGPERTSKPTFLLSFMSPSKSKTAAKHLILGVDGGAWGQRCFSLQPDSHYGPNWSRSRWAGGVILFLPRLAA